MTRGARFEEDLHDELAFHLEERASDLAIRHGIPRAEALRRARAEFGSVAVCREDVRRCLGIHRLDFLHLARILRRSRASSAAAVLTLSLAAGAAVAIFAVADATILTPPPVRDPASLVVLGESPLDAPPGESRAVAYRTFTAWRERAGVAASLEALDGTNLTLTGLGAPERITVADATPGFLELLGAVPALGRLLASGDADGRTIVVSSRFWRDKLGARADAVGHTITLGGVAHTIVGVLPDRFVFALNGPSDMWRVIAPARMANPGFKVGVVGRLRPTASIEQLREALGRVSGESTPPAKVVAKTVADAIAGSARKPIAILAAAAALAMLVAFVNFAGLLMVRSIDRRRELAIRLALGAPQSEIARQLVFEGVSLAAMGTAGGVLLAMWLTPALGHLAFVPVATGAGELGVSWRAAGVVATVAMASGAMCGLFAAAAARRWRILDVLRRGVTSSRGDLRLRRMLVAGEVALAFVLLASMAALGRSLIGMLETAPGFEPGNVLAMAMSLPAERYRTPEQVAAFYSALQSALAERDSVRDVSYIDELPLTHDRGRSNVGPDRANLNREAIVRAAGPGYFGVMKIPVIAGRPLDQDDAGGQPWRAVISRSLASRLFAPGAAVGREFWLASGARMVEVVGVAGDVKHRALDEPDQPTVYLSALQDPSRTSVIVARRSPGGPDVLAAVRREAAVLDSQIPVYGVRPMADVVAASSGVPERRVLTFMFAGFALLALALSAVGLFGVAAHDVGARRSEIALRMALGADPMRILRATIARGVTTIWTGLAVGGVLSIWAVRGLGEFAHAAGHVDVLSFAASGAVLLATGTAALVPAARRAARANVLDALKGL